MILDIEDSEKYYTRIYLDPRIGNGYHLEISQQLFPPAHFNDKGFEVSPITDFAKTIDNIISRYLTYPSIPKARGKKLTYHVNGEITECIAWERGWGTVYFGVETTWLGEFKISYRTGKTKYLHHRMVAGQVSPGVFKEKVKKMLFDFKAQMKTLIIEVFD